MPAPAQSVEISHTDLIIAGIKDVAFTRCGLTFLPNASKLWARPTFVEVMNTGFPFLVVEYPTSAGGADSGVLRGNVIPRLPGFSEPVWDFQCWIFYPQTDPSDPLTYSTPDADKNRILQGFTKYYTLEDTCQKCDIIKPEITEVQLPGAGSGDWLVAISFGIRAYEVLSVIY